MAKNRNRASNLWIALYRSEVIQKSVRNIVASRWRETKLIRLVDKLKRVLEEPGGTAKRESRLTVNAEDLSLSDIKLWRMLYHLTKAKTPVEILYDAEGGEVAASILSQKLEEALQEFENEQFDEGENSPETPGAAPNVRDSSQCDVQGSCGSETPESTTLDASNLTSVGLTGTDHHMTPFELWDSVYKSTYESVSIESLLSEVVAGRWRKTRATRLIGKLISTLHLHNESPTKKRLPTVKEKDVQLRGRELWKSLFSLTQAEIPLKILLEKMGTDDAPVALTRKIGRAIGLLRFEFHFWENLATSQRKDDVDVLEDVSFKLQNFGMYTTEDLQILGSSWAPDEDHILRFQNIVKGLPPQAGRSLREYFKNLAGSELWMHLALKFYHVMALEEFIAEDEAHSEQSPGEGAKEKAISECPHNEPFVQGLSGQSLCNKDDNGEEPCVAINRRRGAAVDGSAGMGTLDCSSIKPLPGDRDIAYELWNSVYRSTSESVSIESLLSEVVAGRWRKTRATRLIGKLISTLHLHNDSPTKKGLPTVKEKDVQLRGRELWKSLFSLTQAATPLNMLLKVEKREKASSTLANKLVQALKEVNNEFKVWEENSPWFHSHPQDIDNTLEDVSFQLDDNFEKEDVQTVNTTWTPSPAQMDKFEDILDDLAGEAHDTLLDFVYERLHPPPEVFGVCKPLVEGALRFYHMMVLKKHAMDKPPAIVDNSGSEQFDEVENSPESPGAARNARDSSECDVQGSCGSDKPELTALEASNLPSVGLTGTDHHMTPFELWESVYNSTYESVSIESLLSEVVAGQWREARAIHLIAKLTTALKEGCHRKQRLGALESGVVKLRGRELWRSLFNLTKAKRPLEILLKKGETESVTSTLIQKLGQALQDLKSEFCKWEQLQNKKKRGRMWAYVIHKNNDDEDDDFEDDDFEVDDVDKDDATDSDNEDDDIYALEDFGLEIPGLFSDKELLEPFTTWTPNKSHVKEFLEISNDFPGATLEILVHTVPHTWDPDPARKFENSAEGILVMFRRLFKWFAREERPKKARSRAFKLWDGVYDLVYQSTSIGSLLNDTVISWRWRKTRAVRLIKKLASEVQVGSPATKESPTMKEEDDGLRDRSLWRGLFRLTNAEAPLEILLNKEGKEEAAYILAEKLGLALWELRAEFETWSAFAGSMASSDDDAAASNKKDKLLDLLEDLSFDVGDIFTQKDLQTDVRSWEPNPDQIKDFQEKFEVLPSKTKQSLRDTIKTLTNFRAHFVPAALKFYHSKASESFTAAISRRGLFTRDEVRSSDSSDISGSTAVVLDQNDKSVEDVLKLLNGSGSVEMPWCGNLLSPIPRPSLEEMFVDMSCGFLGKAKAKAFIQEVLQKYGQKADDEVLEPACVITQPTEAIRSRARAPKQIKAIPQATTPTRSEIDVHRGQLSQSKDARGERPVNAPVNKPVARVLSKEEKYEFQTATGEPKCTRNAIATELAKRGLIQNTKSWSLRQLFDVWKLHEDNGEAQDS